MEPEQTFSKVDQLRQLNVRLALKDLIKIMYKELTQFDYDGRYDDQINTLAEAIATDTVEIK